jgi:type IV secretory pathway VirB6-like protein
MAQATARGEMDVRDQKETFRGFVWTTVWLCTHLAQIVAFLTLGFGIGAGFWAGFAAYVAIGIVAGLLFRLSGVYWAAQIGTWIILALGGLIVPALAGLAG